MEIERKNLNKTINILMKIPYRPAKDNKSVIFFPLASKTKNDDNLVLDIKGNKGAASYLKSGLILTTNDVGNTTIKLAYAQTEYCPKFDMEDYLELQDHSISNKLVDQILSYDCLIVKNDYLVGIYNL